MMIILHQIGIGNKFCVILLILGFGSKEQHYLILTNS